MPVPMAIGSDGKGLMVTARVVTQPVGKVKVMTEVPPATPLTVPVGPTVATVPLLLLQVPVPLVSVVVLPAHATAMPLIAAGKGFTVTIVVALQLAPIENVIIVVPAAMPLTIPVDPMVAMVIALLLQLPPPPSLRAVVSPVQTWVVPAIVPGVEFTVIVLVVVHPVGKV